MKKVLFMSFMVLFFSGFYTVSSQNQADTITMNGKRVYPLKIGNEVLTPKRINEVLASNPEAYKEYLAAKYNSTPALILAGAGGFLIGWPLGQAIGGGEPQWALAGAGAVLVGLSIPLSSAAKKRSIKAVEIYNQGVLKKQSKDPMSMKIVGGANGFGLVLNF
jgi:hypothetical protein